MFKRVGRNFVLLGLLIAVFAMAGCSCKEYEEQIMQLDAQIAEMQQELSEKDSVISEREQVAEDLRNNLQDCQGENAILVEQSEEVVMITVQDDLGFNASQRIVLDTWCRRSRPSPGRSGTTRTGTCSWKGSRTAGVSWRNSRSNIPPTGNWALSAPAPWCVT